MVEKSMRILFKVSSAEGRIFVSKKNPRRDDKGLTLVTLQITRTTSQLVTLASLTGLKIKGTLNN